MRYLLVDRVCGRRARWPLVVLHVGTRAACARARDEATDGPRPAARPRVEPVDGRRAPSGRAPRVGDRVEDLAAWRRRRAAAAAPARADDATRALLAAGTTAPRSVAARLVVALARLATSARDAGDPDLEAAASTAGEALLGALVGARRP